jgi:hypothetical protein
MQLWEDIAGYEPLLVNLNYLGMEAVGPRAWCGQSHIPELWLDDSDIRSMWRQTCRDMGYVTPEQHSLILAEWVYNGVIPITKRKNAEKKAKTSKKWANIVRWFNMY